MSLAEFQEAFSQVLFSPEVAPDAVAQIPHLSPSILQALQFGAYRKRALQGLGDVLREVYPTVEAVMGREAFSAVSDAYFLRHPPRAVDPVVLAEGFGPFLESLESSPETGEKPPAYLPDVATLDFGCFKARQAIDATAMNTRIFTDLSPEQLAARHIQLHPACFWMSSPHAIYDLWRFHHSTFASRPLDLNIPQEVVIIRPQLQVEVHRVDTGLVKVLDALDSGETLNQALIMGSAADKAFNAVAAIQFLVQNDLIISLY
jgi:hypothetical protein